MPDFALTEANCAAVAGICGRVDGLPLAIELAAVRIRAMSAAQIMDRLTDRYRLLTVGSRVAPTRLQTLRSCVDWSYELCTAREQQLWAWLSVFVGGFELDAAEGICPEGLVADDFLDAVASLVDKSILVREQVGDVVRFGMVETIRDYGREKLRESGDLPPGSAAAPLVVRTAGAAGGVRVDRPPPDRLDRPTRSRTAEPPGGADLQPDRAGRRPPIRM